MDRDKIIILALIVIIAALLVGVVAMMPNTKKLDTKLTFKSNATLTEGDSLKIKLTDANGTAIANQTVNVTVTDENSTSGYYSVVTDGNGTGKLKLDNDPGEYTVTISYDGNDNYTVSNATQNLTIKEKAVQAQVTSSSSSVSSSESSDWVDANGNPHYYENGQEYVGTRDGQHMTVEMAEYVREYGMG